MGLKVWLPLNGDLRNQGVSNVNITTTATVNTNGKIGSCYSFSGNYITLSPSIIDKDDTEFSFTCWAKFNSVAQMCLFSNRIATNNAGITIFVFNGTGGKNILFDTGDRWTLTRSAALPTNEWVHLAFTWKKGAQKCLYINGILDGSASTSGNPTEATATTNLIGGSHNSTTTTANYMNGYLNDVRIYNHALSAAEVREISQGLILHYKLDGFNNASNLPPQYQQLEYIESSGTSYFDTGCKFNIETDACKVIFKGNDTSNNGMILASNSSKYFWFYYYSSNGIRVYGHNGSSQEGVNGGNNNLNQHIMEFKNKTYYLDGVNKGTLSNSYTETTHNLWLFDRGNNVNPFKGRIYYTEIIRNGNIQRIFIPAKRLTDSIAGMYDLITNTFYISSNVAFTAGTAVGTLTIQDNSGYNHNGIITGDIQITSNSAHYNNCVYSANGGSNYIQTPTLTMPTDAITLNIWFKTTSNAPTSDYHMVVDSVGNSSGRQHYEMAVYKTGYFRGGLFVNGTRYADNCTTTTGCNGNWHMLTLTYDGAAIKRYFDGNMEKSTTVAMSSGLQQTATLRLFKDGYSTYACINTSLSDFRIYCTALDADTIRQLYEVSAKADNKGNLHTFEINEFGANQLTKTGIMKDYMIEPYKTLPDGSHWQLMLFHYVDGGNNLFTQSNATYCNDFGLYSRLRDINNFTYNNGYEFYVIQDGIEYRWTQTSQPTASSIAGKTVVSGYADPVNGLAKASQSNTYIGYSSWWGACGCWTSYTLSGKKGIPGFGAHAAAGVCTEYLALYARIPDSKFKLANQNAYAENFIEL